jgi:hypothetical protein
MLPIAHYSDATDNQPHSALVAWSELARMLSQFRRGPCTVADCAGKHCPHKNGEAWSPVDIDGPRANRNVRSVSAAVFDIDECADPYALLDSLKGRAALVHTSHSSTPDAPRLRIVLQLSRPVPGTEWRRFWSALNEQLALNADPAAKDPARLYYKPSAPVDGAVYFAELEGAPVNVDAVMAHAPEEDEVGHAEGPAEDDLPPLEYRLVRAGRYVDTMPPAIQGQGGSTQTLKAALAVVKGFCVPPGEALGLLMTRYNPRCEPPWSRDAMRKKIADAAASTKVGYGYLLETPTMPAEPLFTPDPTPDTPSTEKPFSAALDDVSRVMGEVPKREGTKPLFQAADVFMAAQLPGLDWLVRGLITRGGTAVIGAEPKTGKTWIATEIAIGIATGTPVCRTFEVSHPGKVAYFYAEDGGQQVQNRIRSLLAGRNQSVSSLAGHLYVCPRGETLDLRKNQDLAWLVAAARQIGRLDALVLDPLRDIHTGDENSSNDMAEVMRRIRVLGTLLQCTVLVVHHALKSNMESSKRRPGQKLRGSSAIHGSIDSGLYIGLKDGDGKCRFELDVISEVKGGQSAGRFGLSLVITDDESGGARKAEWTKLEEVEEGGGEEADDAKALKWATIMLQREGSMSLTAMRNDKHAPLPQRRMSYALGRLVEAGHLVRTGATKSARLSLPTTTPADPEF